MERLRSYATATNPKCGSSRFKSSAGVEQRQGVGLSWVVPSTGDSRLVQVLVTYRVPPGRTRTDTLRTRILCE